ncbi:hypothetical protein SAMN06265365_12748 [Tistlia consotensis]|uniref:Uncharacterized protein n=1 Tax=Tistlia consotensis USBA 355 TaxID=560819 RepID=A0A1Y6CJW8_9PROT|nr:hypothetical protein [Tistlia consotensis]SMF69923.1 hypothetical protein SAMN05428998_12932 [Tistlia consotensis USBA 355]SNS05086.1 hypothetical protein SAMN06265365_12748 [Tistlia consotensis]
MILLVYAVPTTLVIALTLTLPVWVIRKCVGRFWGLSALETTLWRALGDVAFVFTALLVLAHAGERYAPLAQCFSLLGTCALPLGDVLFAWGFFFQVATVPLGIPIAVFACIEAVRRHRASASKISSPEAN